MNTRVNQTKRAEDEAKQEVVRTSSFEGEKEEEGDRRRSSFEKTDKLSVAYLQLVEAANNNNQHVLIRSDQIRPDRIGSHIRSEIASFAYV